MKPVKNALKCLDEIQMINKSMLSVFTCTMKMQLLYSLAVLMCASHSLEAQVTERSRPEEWKQLVPGGRFMDRFLPMPAGSLGSDVWGAPVVIPRYVDNGIEDAERSYWGGNILKGEDGKYHMFVCGWPESSPKGHFEWPNSTVYHATADNSIGPFTVINTIGQGHNPEAFRLADGRYVVYVIGAYYISDSLNGPWSRTQFTFDPRGRNIIEGLSNLTFAKRGDNSFLMVCRGGGVWISQTGISPYRQISDKRIYPAVAGEFEDPVVWRDHVQYHVIVNDWLGRIAYYLRSPDGIHWVTDPGEAYMPGVARHEDGKKEDWFKYERIKIFQDEHGRAIQANFAVIDVLKDHDKAHDKHSSKNISIPLNPGVLLQILNTEKITDTTPEVRVLIQAEKGFDPLKDVDVASLRFGPSSEVNFGRGWKVLRSEASGKDLLLTFQTEGTGLPEEEFAPKLLGRSSAGNMLFGYARLPWVNYNPAILSPVKPSFSLRDGKMEFHAEIENFGQVPSQGADFELVLMDGDKSPTLARTSISGVMVPYASKELTLTMDYSFEPGKQYRFKLLIKGRDGWKSSFEFTETPQKAEKSLNLR